MASASGRGGASGAADRLLEDVLHAQREKAACSPEEPLVRVAHQHRNQPAQRGAMRREHLETGGEGEDAAVAPLSRGHGSAGGDVFGASSS